jgi:hypothetical protein
VKPQVVPLFHRHKLFDSFSLICGRKWHKKLLVFSGSRSWDSRDYQFGLGWRHIVLMMTTLISIVGRTGNLPDHTLKGCNGH